MWLKLTLEDGRKILRNMDRYDAIGSYGQRKGCAITNAHEMISVLETFKEIEAMLIVGNKGVDS